MIPQIMDLTRMRPGEKGVVVDILGESGIAMRLETLGIRPDIEIIKVSEQFARGPIVVRVGNTRSALGFGMAKKIIIQLIK